MFTLFSSGIAALSSTSVLSCIGGAIVGAGSALLASTSTATAASASAGFAAGGAVGIAITAIASLGAGAGITYAITKK